MRTRLLPLAAVLALAVAPPASAAVLQGDQFITAVKDNTVSGKIRVKGHDHAAFNLYFLPGGQVTYTDTTGARDDGTWRLDANGDVCVAWQRDRAVPRGCFRVVAHGRHLSWYQKSTEQASVFRGGVTTTFLKPTPR